MNDVLIPTVRNVRDVGRRDTYFQVYVGRPTMWSNPYELGVDGNRATVLAYYRRYLYQLLSRDQEFLEPLRGKDLVCWCAPKPCHADLLLELANLDEHEQDAFFRGLANDNAI